MLSPEFNGLLMLCFVGGYIHFKEFYKDEPFVRVFEGPVDIKSCGGTNFCDIYAQRKGKKLYVNSAVDNILRGSSSQAVANANLMCGYDENTALPIIAYVP